MKQPVSVKEIKNMLKTNNVSQKTIADILNISPVCVHDVVVGKRKNPKIRRAIAIAAGIHVSEIWPDEQQRN